MGFIDDIPDEKYDRKYGDFYLFKRLFTYMGQKDLPTFMKLIVWLLITTGSNVGIPYLIRFVIELIEAGRIDYLIYLLASFVAVFYAINWFGQ